MKKITFLATALLMSLGSFANRHCLTMFLLSHQR